ncbi:hypothetical protein KA554_001803 [Salmonella enterica subsp. enterica serovar 13,23:y:e,n,z15]|nr:hypothetical protein [Salmonella enterica subsp. enterica]EEJ2448083.1 hypothetical protein [Salmonella enterica subsp. enterica]EJU7761695.1 hypothetical protein [Salmonella enterica subsp. enterica serovar 13,23:y:e,n,z15]
MVKYLLFVLFIFSASVLSVGRVNDLCLMNRVKKIEIINIPLYIATRSDITEEQLGVYYTYKFVMNDVKDNESEQLINLLQMKYIKQERNNSLRWRVYIVSDEGNKCDLYFDGFGFCGKVNDVNLCFEQNKMIDWIVKKIPLFEQ